MLSFVSTVKKLLSTAIAIQWCQHVTFIIDVIIIIIIIIIISSCRIYFLFTVTQNKLHEGVFLPLSYVVWINLTFNQKTQICLYFNVWLKIGHLDHFLVYGHTSWLKIDF